MIFCGPIASQFEARKYVQWILGGPLLVRNQTDGSSFFSTVLFIPSIDENRHLFEFCHEAIKDISGCHDLHYSM